MSDKNNMFPTEKLSHKLHNIFAPEAHTTANIHNDVSTYWDRLTH